MKRSTRTLIVMIALDLCLIIGAAWLVFATKSQMLHAPDPHEAIMRIFTVAGAAIGGLTGLMGVIYVTQRRRGE